MKQFLYALILFLWFSNTPCAAQNSVAKKITELETQLIKQPANKTIYQQLHDLIVTNYQQTTLAERTHVRELLKKYGKWNSATTYAEKEPGLPIVIKGHITNTNGQPITNALINVFQTNSHGYYTPNDSASKKMGEPDARLFAFLQTDANGNFEIHTVRPGSYPIKYEGRYIPQHVHLNITAAGYESNYLQMVFEDDPVMSDYWRAWAKRLNFPILKLVYANGQASGNLELKLSKG